MDGPYYIEIQSRYARSWYGHGVKDGMQTEAIVGPLSTMSGDDIDIVHPGNYSAKHNWRHRSN